VLSYRLYFLSNNRLQRWQDIEAEHDLAAIEAASQLAGEHSVELWFGKRKITTFEAGQDVLGSDSPMFVASTSPAA
jgi:hypothetical protein